MQITAAAPIAPDLDRTAEELELAHTVVLAARRWRARLDERLRGIGQTSARWAALYWIAHSPAGLNQRDLAERLGIETPTLVRLIDLLEEQGMVERRTDPRDRRAKILTATPEARAALAEGERISAAMRKRLLASSSHEEIATTLRVLTRLSLQLERM